MDGAVGSSTEAVIDVSGDSEAVGWSQLCGIASLEDLVRWRDEVVDLYRQLISSTAAVTGVGGPDGDGPGMAYPVAISTMEARLAAGIDRMRGNGALVVEVDPARLATSLAAALQGGSLLARVSRDITRLEAALDAALSCVRSHSAG